jgi:drug/metabolite transporter (DMT)-like permease
MLKPLEVAAMVTVPNGLLIALWAIPNEGLQSLSLLSPQALAIQVLMQSLVVGIFSGLFYSLAIRKIGAEKTATIGAATPLVATFGAFIFLQESLDILPLLGVCLTAVGVVIAAKTPHK